MPCRCRDDKGPMTRSEMIARLWSSRWADARRRNWCSRDDGTVSDIEQATKIARAMVTGTA